MLLRIKRNVSDNKCLNLLKETDPQSLVSGQEGLTPDVAFGLGLVKEDFKKIKICCGVVVRISDNYTKRTILIFIK